MSGKDNQHIPEKKKRKRLKRLCAQIREQMEFYFGDSNLNKDRFLKHKMEEDKDKYVPLEIFLNFNKMKALTDDVSLIAKALSTSELLAVSSDGLKVKRVTPLVVREDVDDRTIYVEGLPQNVDHDWVKSHFSKYGEVLYVSLPKYKSSGDIKGFAFVEFDSVEAASHACGGLSVEGNPEQIGKFPKVNKQIKQLQKKVASQKQSTDPEEQEIPVLKKGRRKHSQASESSEGETPAKRPRHESEKSEDDSDHDEDDTADSASNKENTEQESTSQPSKKDGSSEKAGKRKLVIDENEESKEAKRVRINEEVQVKETERNKHKRRRQRHRSSSVSEAGKETPQLTVISKAQWLKLKAEYLSLQKKSMHQLKCSLKTAARRNRSQAESNRREAKAEEGSKELTFMPNVIVKVDSDKPSSRKELKERLIGTGDIAYIDFQDEQCSGHIRCSSAEVANRIVATNLRGFSFSMVKGDEEQKYWSKILADRQKKRSSKQRTKKRGTDRIHSKVERLNSEAVQRRHVVFDD